MFIDRRSLLAVLAATPAVSSFSRIAIADTKVRLLLLRSADYANRCVECIPGKLYGIPAAISDAAAIAAPGLLTKICDTIELSYEENAPNRSSIPKGTYPATIKMKGTKKSMWSSGVLNQGSILEDRAWRLELQGVPGNRTAIQFHYGKDSGWSEGCVIIGTSPANTCKDDCKHGDSPSGAVSALRQHVEGRMNASNTPISILIADGDISA